MISLWPGVIFLALLVPQIGGSTSSSGAPREPKSYWKLVPVLEQKNYAQFGRKSPAVPSPLAAGARNPPLHHTDFFDFDKRSPAHFLAFVRSGSDEGNSAVSEKGAEENTLYSRRAPERDVSAPGPGSKQGKCLV